jgi:SAM-dependent methyltransferase
MSDPGYRRIVEHYEGCLARHGDTHLGVDWPRPEDAEKRYAVMLGVIRPGDQGRRVIRGEAALECGSLLPLWAPELAPSPSDAAGPPSSHPAERAPRSKAGASSRTPKDRDSEGGENVPSLLDFGCGAGHLYESMIRRGIRDIRYSGLDLSERFVGLCRSKHPGVDFHRLDVLEADPETLPRFDYVVASGVFTAKRELPFEEMLAYFERLVARLFAMAGVGIAFNVMSSHVDWERDDLFHLPVDTVARFLTSRVTRHFVVRNDYGLYEYTVYAYREPSPWPGSSSSA